MLRKGRPCRKRIILLCLLYNSENAAVYPADKIIEKAENLHKLFIRNIRAFPRAICHGF